MKVLERELPLSLQPVNIRQLRVVAADNVCQFDS